MTDEIENLENQVSELKNTNRELQRLLLRNEKILRQDEESVVRWEIIKHLIEVFEEFEIASFDSLSKNYQQSFVTRQLIMFKNKYDLVRKNEFWYVNGNVVFRSRTYDLYNSIGKVDQMLNTTEQ